MTNLLQRLLEEKETLVADGAMGTNLFDLGLANGACPELWNVDAPERVASVHRAFAQAGADIVLTNTFGGNRFRLALHDLAGRVRELNVAGAQVARAAAAASGRRVVVAGSIGPTGEVLEPLGTRSLAEAEEGFHEQAEALRTGGVDVAWIETMFSLDELAAAVRAVTRAGLPYVATMSFDTAGCTMMGTRPSDALRGVRTYSPRPLAFGANCGVGPAQLIATVLELAAAADDRDVIVAKGNCGLPRLDKDMKTTYDGTPAIMAAYAVMARDAGARIIGGCCGTRAAHIRAMAQALAATPKGSPPSTADIEVLTPQTGDA